MITYGLNCVPNTSFVSTTIVVISLSTVPALNAVTFVASVKTYFVPLAKFLRSPAFSSVTLAVEVIFKSLDLIMQSISPTATTMLLNATAMTSPIINNAALVFLHFFILSSLFVF